MIQGLIDRVGQTQLPDKDPQAEQLLRDGLGRNPDAVYILSQTVLVQGYALEQAQKQIAGLKSQLEQTHQQTPPPPRQSTSFLGNLLGHHDPAPPPPPPSQSNPAYAPVPGYGPPPPQYGAPQPPQFGGPQFGGAQPGGAQPAAGGGFLRGAVQTAAGVAAGALAFQGIESLMHGFGGSSAFGGGQGFGGFGGGAPREEVVNNYYGDSARDRGDSGLSSDIEDRRNDAASGDSNSDDRFAGDIDSSASNDDTGSDYSTDNTSDDSSFDSGSSDDSTFDSGGDDSSFS